MKNELPKAPETGLFLSQDFQRIFNRIPELTLLHEGREYLEPDGVKSMLLFLENLDFAMAGARHLVTSKGSLTETHSLSDPPFTVSIGHKRDIRTHSFLNLEIQHPLSALKVSKVAYSLIHEGKKTTNKSFLVLSDIRKEYSFDENRVTGINTSELFYEELPGESLHLPPKTLSIPSRKELRWVSSYIGTAGGGLRNSEMSSTYIREPHGGLTVTHGDWKTSYDINGEMGRQKRVG